MRRRRARAGKMSLFCSLDIQLRVCFLYFLIRERSRISASSISRFFSHTVDRGRPFQTRRRVLLKQLYPFGNRSFELRIAPFDHIGRRVFNLDVRRDADIFDIPLPLQVIECQARRGDTTAVYCRRSAKCTDQSTPRACSNQRPEFAKVKHIRESVAARSGRLINDHHLRTEYPRQWRGRRLAVTQGEIAHRFPVKLVYDVVRHHAALVVSLVYHRSVSVLLGIKITRKIRITGARGIRQPNVSESPAGKLVDKPSVVLDPSPRPKRAFARDRDHSYEPRTIHRRCFVDPNDGLPPRRSFKQTIRIDRGHERPTIHFQNIIALSHPYSGRAERRPKIGIPILAAVDLADAVPSVLYRQVRPQ